MEKQIYTLDYLWHFEEEKPNTWFRSFGFIDITWNVEKQFGYYFSYVNNRLENLHNWEEMVKLMERFDF